MRLFKLITTLIILGLIAAFVVQNMTTWTQVVGFRYNLVVLDEWKPGLELYLIMLLSTLFGLFLGIAIMLKPYSKARRALVAQRNENKSVAPVEVKEVKTEEQVEA